MQWLSEKWRRFGEWVDEKIAGPSINELLVLKAHKARKEVEDADKHIRGQKYNKHMALFELKAIEEWTHGRIAENIEDLPL